MKFGDAVSRPLTGREAKHRIVRQMTPAMAAGISNYIWNVREPLEAR
jgi:hypothetical protein